MKTFTFIIWTLVNGQPEPFPAAHGITLETCAQYIGEISEGEYNFWNDGGDVTIDLVGTENYSCEAD